MQQNHLYLPLNFVKIVVAELLFIAVISFILIVLNLIGVIGIQVSAVVFGIFSFITGISLYLERKYILRRIFT